MVKIAIDAGHGLNSPGKRTPAGEREWSFNNVVALATIAKLNTYKDVQIRRLDDPTGNVDIPLRTRTNNANNWGADVLVSIHHNAYQGAWGAHGGVESYTNDRPGANPESVKIAALIQPRIVKAMELRDRGLKKKNLHMTRESHMPAVLTEGGFMDSTTDIIAMRDDNKLKAQGVAIAEGVAAYYKLKPIVEHVPRPNPSSKPEQQIPVTGVWDATLTKALQAYFKTTIDGVVSGQPKNRTTQNIPSVKFGKGGSQLIMAMQRFYGTKIDGELSGFSQMIGAAQMKYKLKVDYFVSNPSALIMEIQRRLNSGKL